MANMMSLLKKLNPQCKEAFKNAEINLVQLVQFYKNKKQWDVAQDTVLNFQETLDPHFSDMLGSNGSTSNAEIMLTPDTIAALGHFVHLILQVNKSKKNDLAASASDNFKHMCDALKGAGEETFNQMVDTVKIRAIDAVMPVAMLTKKMSPISKMLFFAGMMAVGIYNNAGALKRDINALYDSYTANDPKEIGKNSVKVVADGVYSSLCFLGISNLFKTALKSNVVGEGYKALKRGIRGALSTSQPIYKLSAEIENYVGNVIKKFDSTAFADTHMFSRKHNRTGIRQLGSSDEMIVEKVSSLIIKSDMANLPKEGDNQMLTMIKGHFATVRFRIFKGKVINVNGFKGESKRKIGNYYEFYEQEDLAKKTFGP